MAVSLRIRQMTVSLRPFLTAVMTGLLVFMMGSELNTEAPRRTILLGLKQLQLTELVENAPASSARDPVVTEQPRKRRVELQAQLPEDEKPMALEPPVPAEEPIAQPPAVPASPRPKPAELLTQLPVGGQKRVTQQPDPTETRRDESPPPKPAVPTPVAQTPKPVQKPRVPFPALTRPPVYNAKGENQYFAYYNEQRANGEAEQREWIKRDFLVGHPKRAVIDGVCGRIKNGEEKQMCRKWGVEMADRLHVRYEKLTAKDALIKHLRREDAKSDRAIRITVSHGKLLSWQYIGLEMIHYPAPGALALVRIMQLLRLGRLRQAKTVDFFVRHADKCPNWQNDGREQAHPTVFFNTFDRCDLEQALSYSYLEQASGFEAEEFVPYDELVPKALYRGTPRNDHRFWVVVFKQVFPWLDAVDTVYNNNPTINWCNDSLIKLAESQLPELAGTGFPYLAQCQLKDPQSIWGSPMKTKQQYKFKYLVNIDGSAGLFRLSGNMMAPGVVMLVNNTNSHLSYTRDLIPFVTHIPVRTDLGIFAQDLNQTYHWAETHPDVTRKIAEESTRWAKLHASDRAFVRQWELYHALLADLRLDNATDPYIDGPALPDKVPLKYQRNEVSCENRTHFFEVGPFKRFVGLALPFRDRLWHIACEEMLDLAGDPY
ncbi:hypothetical protein DIPPA_30625 [Diplonema papillatum]|nr:hypothetical protein DIPPA_30625 [Diplonema papillatum]